MAGIHVEVGYIAGHLGRDANGECTNLLVDVLHEGVGGPASLLFNGESRSAVEVHSHGTPRAKGVATDQVGSDAKGW